MKVPKFSKLLPFKPRKKLHASTTARRSAPMAGQYDDDEPQTRLSSAFIVVLILHVVAVGGIYAFNSIKAHRKGQETVSSSSATTSPELTTSTAPPPAPAPPLHAERPIPSQPAPQASTVLPPTPPAASGRTHRVVAGDNLTKIAAQYSVSVADLEEANGSKKGATLRVGQVLTIPRMSTASTPRGNAPATYVVAKDDNPASIARRLHVSYAELLKLNNIEDPKKLQPGQKLKVPAAKKAN